MKEREITLEQEEDARDTQDQLFLALALIPPLVAFDIWDEISQHLAIFLDKYGAVGRAVDGGNFAVTLLRPTITGVVVPVISIALATLVSTTVNVLRARQVELRALINKEACELRLLRRAIRGMFGTRQHANRRARALALLAAYVKQLQLESSAGAVNALEELQLSGGIAVNELEQLSEMLHGVDGAAASRQGSVGVADGLIHSLNGHRSDRVALILSVFPVVHWGVLIALSLSVCATFLMNSNQQVLQYLSSVQLRALFAILVGVFSGTATLCFDLSDPFTGTFSITEASTQLEDLRLRLEQDVAEAAAESGEISSRLVLAILEGNLGQYLAKKNSTINPNESKTVPVENMARGTTTTTQQGGDPQGDARKTDYSLFADRRYGIVSTVYFHLLTGPLGSNVRALGDIIAWAATFVTKRARSLSQRLSTFWRSKPRTHRASV